MNNFEYVAMIKKLSEIDDRNNLITGLVITTIVIGGIAYFQYQKIKSQKEQIGQGKKENIRMFQQYAQLFYEKFRLQGTVNQLKKSNELLTKKMQENDIQKNNA